jgi:predicted RNase H-like nuclease
MSSNPSILQQAYELVNKMLSVVMLERGDLNQGIRECTDELVYLGVNEEVAKSLIVDLTEESIVTGDFCLF